MSCSLSEAAEGVLWSHPASKAEHCLLGWPHHKGLLGMGLKIVSSKQNRAPTQVLAYGSLKACPVSNTAWRPQSRT